MGEHMGDYECGMCGAQFGDRYSLESHITAMHGGQRGLSFECGTCGEKFGSSNELTSHNLYAHPKYVVPPKTN